MDEQIRTYIAPLTKQLETLTRLVQEFSGVHQKNLFPWAGTSANSSAAFPSPDVVTEGTETSPENWVPMSHSMQKIISLVIAGKLEILALCCHQ